MFNKKIIIGGILTALSVLLIAQSYNPAYSSSGFGFSSRGAYFKPEPLSLGILILIFGGITLAKGIKEYFGRKKNPPTTGGGALPCTFPQIRLYPAYHQFY